MVERAWMLYDKRFSAFHYPVTDEDAPNYRSIIQNPMDMATMLQRVDSGQYITCSGFLQDIDLIVTNAKMHGMLSQMDPALVTYCDKLLLKGLGTVTRTSARLRNVQPDVNLDQSYEALKWQKKNADATQAGVFIASTPEDKSRHQDSVQEKPPEEAGADDMNPDRPESSSADDSRHETSGGEASGHTEGSGSPKMLQCQKPKSQATWITSSGFSWSALKIMHSTA
uniref:Bromo domain-containing protein n=1 Tax=Populus alba TaxID=43335 RepID=A0A4U5QDH8_POPAL|nr:hypothetical protein D5086_0000104250 [Populus alba]